MNFIHSGTSKTRFTLKELNELTTADLKAMNLMVMYSPYPNIRIEQFLEKTGIQQQGLNGQESAMLADLILSRETGTSVYSSSFEEKVYVKGGRLTYSETEIVMCTRGGEQVTLPNSVLVPSAVPKRYAEEKIACILYALFDFQKGVLVPIRDAKIDCELFSDPGTTFKPEGIPTLMRIVRSLLSAEETVFKKEQTQTGHQAAEFWYQFVAGLNDTDYHAMHYHIINQLLRQVTYVAPKDGGSVAPRCVKKALPNGQYADSAVSPKAFTKSNLPGAKDFEAKTKILPILLTGQIKPMSRAPMVRSDRDLCAFHKLCVSLRGGNSRGVGLVASYADYCPRQSQTFRRINWLIMAAMNCKAQHIDIHAHAGDLSALKIWQATSRLQFSLCIIVPNESTKGVVRLPHYRTTARSIAHQIAIVDWLPVPEVVFGTKKQEAGMKNIEAALETFKTYRETLGPSWTIQVPWFTESQADSYLLTAEETVTPKVFRHGRGHDLMVTMSTSAEALHHPNGTPWKSATNWANFMTDATSAMRYFNGWHWAGEPIFSTLGTWFNPQNVTATVVDGVWDFSVHSLYVPPSSLEDEYDDSEYGETPVPSFRAKRSLEGPQENVVGTTTTTTTVTGAVTTTTTVTEKSPLTPVDQYEEEEYETEVM